MSDAVGPHLRFLAARDTTSEIRTLPPERWSPQLHATLVHFVFPNSIFVYHPDYISHLGMYPDAVDETLFVHTMLIPETPTDEKAEEHWRRSFELIDTNVFNSEDLVVCEQIQRGLRSGANEVLIVGRLEQNLSRFHSSIEGALALVPIHKRILFSGVARRAVVGLRRVPVHFRVVIAAQGERIV